MLRSKISSMLRSAEVRQNVMLAGYWLLFGASFYVLEWLVPARKYHSGGYDQGGQKVPHRRSGR